MKKELNLNEIILPKEGEMVIAYEDYADVYSKIAEVKNPFELIRLLEPAGLGEEIFAIPLDTPDGKRLFAITNIDTYEYPLKDVVAIMRAEDYKRILIDSAVGKDEEDFIKRSEEMLRKYMGN